MPRKMKPAPEGVRLVSTSRGTWIAFWEEWEGDTLIDIHPMRPAPDGGITQARERREILAEVERTIAETEIRRLRQENRTLRESGRESRGTANDAQRRYASAG